MRYGGKRAMGNEFSHRVKVRNWNDVSAKWHYEYFRTYEDACIYAQKNAERQVKVQVNRY